MQHSLITPPLYAASKAHKLIIAMKDTYKQKYIIYQQFDHTFLQIFYPCSSCKYLWAFESSAQFQIQDWCKETKIIATSQKQCQLLLQDLTFLLAGIQVTASMHTQQFFQIYN